MPRVLKARLSEGPKAETGATVRDGEPRALLNSGRAPQIQPSPSSLPVLLLDKAVVAFAALGLKGAAESGLPRLLPILSGLS